MWKKHKLVMLPTEKAKIYVSRITGQLGLYKEEKTYTGESQGRHLYILSDDESKENEICVYYKSLFLIEHILYTTGAFRHLNPKRKIEGRFLPNMEKGIFDSMTPLKKIVATTNGNISINLGKEWQSLQIPQLFIDQFISSYNEGKIISEVMVEYEEDLVKIYDNLGGHPGGHWEHNPENNGFKLKINSNNTINIKLIKDNFSRDEVIELLKEFNDRFGSLSLIGDFKSQDRPKFNKWIEEKI